MHAAFNVLDAPWIPVVSKDGTTNLLGVREVLQQAAELKEISAPPLEEYCLYRFLGVFLMDALRPQRIGEIQRLYKNGAFDMNPIEEYISQCESEGVSFDLFDQKRPFLQSPYNEETDKVKPISSINFIKPSGNNHIHFDHDYENVYAVSAAKAARLLLSLQQFCTAGVQDYPSGVNGAPPYFGVVKGNNLFETLVFTLVPLQSIDNFDNPPVIWRASEPVGCKKLVGETSWLRGMCFPARRVLLVPPDKTGLVSQVYLSQGENFKNSSSWFDPYVTYRSLESGMAPLRPKIERPIWRNLCDIVDIKNNHASLLLAQHINHFAESPYVRVTLYGISTNKAKYLDLVHHDLTLRKDLAQSEQAIDFIRQAISVTEQLAKSLKSCLCPSKVKLLPGEAANAAITEFYDNVERRFWQICDMPSLEGSISEEHSTWIHFVSESAINAFDNALTKANLRGKTLAVAAQQRFYLNREIKMIKEAFQSE